MGKELFNKKEKVMTDSSGSDIPKLSWFGSVKSPKLKSYKKQVTNTPSGLWKKCSNCAEILQTSRLKENLNVCPYCDHHFRVSAMDRLEMIVDKDTFEEWGTELRTTDPLEFIDKTPYKERLATVFENTGLHDGTLSGLAKIGGNPVAISLMDFSFMGGSMGVVTGEKIAFCLEKALEDKIPAIIISCSGGARMQEGLLSLMQMAKTASVIRKLKNEGIPFFSVLTDPTTGGVAASFAMLGDVNFSEPKALIGFAGPRVIEQSIRETLPEGFQRAEFLCEHGFIDRIVHRHNLRAELTFFIEVFKR